MHLMWSQIFADCSPEPFPLQSVTTRASKERSEKANERFEKAEEKFKERLDKDTEEHEERLRGIERDNKEEMRNIQSDFALKLSNLSKDSMRLKLLLLARLLDYSKELNFWRDTVRKVLYDSSNDKKAENLINHITDMLKTYGTRSNASEDFETIKVLAGILANPEDSNTKL